MNIDKLLSIAQIGFRSFDPRDASTTYDKDNFEELKKLVLAGSGKMNLYLVHQNSESGYDTYDSFVVSAPDEETARRTHPEGECIWYEEEQQWFRHYHTGERYAISHYDWAQHIAHVNVVLIGKSNIDDYVIISASFNAG